MTIHDTCANTGNILFGAVNYRYAAMHSFIIISILTCRLCVW